MIPTPLKLSRLAPLGDGVRKLPFPASPKLRVAHISAGACFEGVKQLGQANWPELESYNPRVLVGNSADLEKLVRWSDRSIITLTSIDRAIFVTTNCGQPPLTDVLRVVLWQTFGVPVYELFMSPVETMIASECEAQEGWHVESGAQFFLNSGELMISLAKQSVHRTGLTGRIRSEPCPCGRSGLRITDIKAFQGLAVVHQLPAHQLPLHQLAATA